MTTLIQTLHELSCDSALTMIQAAKQKAEQLGLAICVSVVGPQGLPLASIRMNGAPLHSITLAEDKAYTAVSFKRPTHEWDERLASQPKVQQALATRDRFTMLGGGLPIRLTLSSALTTDSELTTSLEFTPGSNSIGSLTESTVLVGAVGVSGGSVQQDIECAEAAIAALLS
ncbi:Uncharacterized conserved protein GlcG, DUF336 family [Oceanospirillum multiglobuliferum]|uniref:Heme-binding protein n=1 Tax=Oceanospirillum multiglobuliferum TaxID=64969 RepID=A0A1T4QLK4_9GAMM|nr:heme-binding protein [Oceanospirillum multiglobuliferum]OPX56431.1 hypothetical protein BTE48_03100 [Oceanospirillum multiglobuliferum]SKA04556.1 Uncharacterized conserved protein GlcG, DUF336 family [Oceanospirillum multiglobuliferum]